MSSATSKLTQIHQTKEKKNELKSQILKAYPHWNAKKHTCKLKELCIETRANHNSQHITEIDALNFKNVMKEPGKMTIQNKATMLSYWGKLPTTIEETQQQQNGI